jgi:hypothetical protein
VLAPDGTELTIEGQGDNHQHHHGLWFTHGDVNGVIFWNERDDTRGRILNNAVEISTKDNVGWIRSHNRWVGPGGVLHLTDETTVRIQGDDEVRLVDYEVSLRAPPTNQSCSATRRKARWQSGFRFG